MLLIPTKLSGWFFSTRLDFEKTLAREGVKLDDSTSACYNPGTSDLTRGRVGTRRRVTRFKEGGGHGSRQRHEAETD